MEEESHKTYEKRTLLDEIHGTSNMQANGSAMKKTNSTENDEITCKIHGQTEVIIDTNSFKLVCKKCISEGREEGLLSRSSTTEFPTTVTSTLSEEDFCDSHQAQKIAYFCEDCKEALCSTCFSQHQNHKIITAFEIQDRIKQTLSKNSDKVKNVQQRIDENLKIMTDFNNTIKGIVTKTKSQINNLNTTLDKILKDKLKTNLQNFTLTYKGIDNETEEAFKRLALMSKKCNRLVKEIQDIEYNMKIYKTNVKTCVFVKNASASIVEAKRIIEDSKSFLGQKIVELKARGEDQLKFFKKESEVNKKKESIYERSIGNSIVTGASSQSLRLRRFFKYTIEDLSYFKKSSLFFSVNRTTCLTGIGVCGLLASPKNDRNLKLSVTIAEFEDGESTRVLNSEVYNLKSVLNAYDPVLAFYFPKVLTLLPKVTYLITCENLEVSNQYVEIWRGKVFFEKEPTQEQSLSLKCNDSPVVFKFLQAKGVETDFNEFRIGIISDLIYSA